jgi:hypothetical protein
MMQFVSFPFDADLNDRKGFHEHCWSLLGEAIKQMKTELGGLVETSHFGDFRYITQFNSKTRKPCMQNQKNTSGSLLY